MLFTFNTGEAYSMNQIIFLTIINILSFLSCHPFIIVLAFIIVLEKTCNLRQSFIRKNTHYLTDWSKRITISMPPL
tara:strand:+ start:5145 stop:5372 length:228 start_codon:yes stop_codon:yes gene_type:complete